MKAIFIGLCFAIPFIATLIYVLERDPNITSSNTFVAYVEGNEYIIDNLENIKQKGDFFIMKTSDNRQIRFYQVGNTTIKLVEQKLQRENGLIVETEGVVHVK
jgi:hypothetical protein